jgi:hypothetical protein
MQLAQLTTERGSEKKKKEDAQKAKSHYYWKWMSLHKNPCVTADGDMTTSVMSTLPVEEGEDAIQPAELKNTDGSFTQNVRLCAIDLMGLEFTAENVPGVIKTI